MIKITFTLQELDIIQKHAMAARLGGASNIRGGDRQEKLAVDQLVGQLGEAALCKHITGSIELYDQTRKKKNENKWAGDNGSDLLGFAVDVKTSVVRRGLYFIYNLWVREREYHQDTVYVLALVPQRQFCVFLVGWCCGRDIKTKNGDRYEIKSSDLIKMESFQMETRLRQA